MKKNVQPDSQVKVLHFLIQGYCTMLATSIIGILFSYSVIALTGSPSSTPTSLPTHISHPNCVAFFGSNFYFYTHIVAIPVGVVAFYFDRNSNAPDYHYDCSVKCVISRTNDDRNTNQNEDVVLHLHLLRFWFTF